MPIITLTASIIIITISIFQIIHKENTYNDKIETETVAMQDNVESVREPESATFTENTYDKNVIIDTNSDIHVDMETSTININNAKIKVNISKKLFAKELFKDFLILNIATIICLIEILLKKKNWDFIRAFLLIFMFFALPA